MGLTKPFRPSRRHAPKLVPGQAELRGLGDAVALLAKRVANLLDDTLGTDLEHCTGCNSRQARLNQIVPFRPLQRDRD